MRVQFTVTASEWAELQQLATRNGYPDVPSYCKDVSLQARTYAKMWAKVKEAISKMGSGTTFQLSDLVQTPPSNLGRKLYDNQSTLGIVVNPTKTNGTNTFTKL